MSSALSHYHINDSNLFSLPIWNLPLQWWETWLPPSSYISLIFQFQHTCIIVSEFFLCTSMEKMLFTRVQCLWTVYIYLYYFIIIYPYWLLIIYSYWHHSFPKLYKSLHFPLPSIVRFFHRFVIQVDCFVTSYILS